MLILSYLYGSLYKLKEKIKPIFQHVSESNPEEQPEADTHPTANITAGPGKRGRGTRERTRHVRGQHSLREQGIGFCVS